MHRKITLKGALTTHSQTLRGLVAPSFQLHVALEYYVHNVGTFKFSTLDVVAVREEELFGTMEGFASIQGIFMSIILVHMQLEIELKPFGEDFQESVISRNGLDLNL